MSKPKTHPVFVAYINGMTSCGHQHRNLNRAANCTPNGDLYQVHPTGTRTRVTAHNPTATDSTPESSRDLDHNTERTA